MSQSHSIGEKNPVVEFALSSIFTTLYVLDLPDGSSQREANILLRKWTHGLCQGTFRSRIAGKVAFFDLPHVEAVIQQFPRNRSRIVAAVTFSGMGEGGDQLAFRYWRSLASGCGIHVLPCTEDNKASITRCCEAGDHQLFVRHTELGLPASSHIQESEPPAVVPFFSDEQIPEWADLRCWVSRDFEHSYFGFATYKGRNGHGDCLLAHFFYSEGDELLTSTRSVPVLPNDHGIDVRSIMKENIPADTILMRVELEQHRFDSGHDLHEALSREVKAPRE